jgi:hypothetical protein
MRHDTQQGVLFEGLSGKDLAVEFDAPLQSSEGGLPLLMAVDREIGLTARLAGELLDPREEQRVEHSLTELVRQRVFSIALGYVDGNDAARIGADPLLKHACGRSPTCEASLASQPTLSRFERGRGGRELVRMSRRLEDSVIDRLARTHRRARRITIDLDSTDDPTHGQQPFAFYHAHYDSWCYLPLLGFLSIDDEPEQHLFYARLRPGTARDVRCVRALLLRLVPKLKARFRRARVLVRLDAGFAGPDLLELLEELGVSYVLAIGQNRTLDGLAAQSMHAARVLSKRLGGTTTLFGECSYSARTWSRERRVIFKAEVVCQPGKEPRDNQRFVATNLRRSPQSVWELYRQRGDVENRIKELKRDLQIDRTSSTSFLANQLRVLLTATAYVLFQALRRKLARTQLAHAQVATLRLKLLKIGATVRETWRRIVLVLPTNYPWKDLWLRAALAAGARPR